jgi:predicted ArsR family transcriptional regulator
MTTSKSPSKIHREPLLSTVAPTRQAILTALKRGGPLVVRQLSEQLGVTTTAVRQQMRRLEQDGLVAVGEDVSGSRGRPAHRYSLTPSAEALFPKRYGDLTTELLGYLGGPEANAVNELFDQRRRRRVAEATERLAGLSLDQQVELLATILDQDGYLADVERRADGSWLIVEHNCAILTVARGFSQACSSELEFIRESLPGASVERVAHLMDGAHVCAYLVRPVADGAS